MLTTLILLTAIGAPYEGDCCPVPVFATITTERKLAEVTYTVTGFQPVRRTVGAVARARPVRTVAGAVLERRVARRMVAGVFKRIQERPRLRRVRRAVFGR